MKFPSIILCLVICAIHRVLCAETEPAPVSAGTTVREIQNASAEITARISKIHPGLSRRQAEENLGSGWYELGGGPSGEGYLATYWNPAYAGLRVQIPYGWTYVHKNHDEIGDELIRKAESNAPVLAAPGVVENKQRVDGAFRRVAQAAPLQRLFEGVGMMRPGAMSLEDQSDYARWIVFLMAQLLALSLLLIGIMLRRPWSPWVGLALGVIAAWIVANKFQINPINDLDVAYHDSVGYLIYDGNGENVAVLLFGWVPALFFQGLIAVFVVFLWPLLRSLFSARRLAKAEPP